MTIEHKLPFHLDNSAMVVGIYAVVDINHKTVREFETHDEAVTFVAKANGSDVETVQEDTARHGLLMEQYLENFRCAKRQTELGEQMKVQVSV